MREAIQRLDEAGHVAYAVGGSVRDFLLGKEPKDHDIATSASPDELCRLFPEAITVGKAFGVLKVPIARTHDGETILLEVASFRQDLEYKDHRHPSRVVFSGPIEDARRRDFTVNALFYDPKTARLLDAVGGVADLRAGVIRAIGDPSERFREDALRLLRAVRFTSTLGFSLDPATAEAVRARSKLIDRVSAERIRDELTLMWTRPHPSRALTMLSELGLLSRVIPELEALHGVEQSPIFHPEGDVWKHTVKILDCLARARPARTPTLAWATLLHDIGKPAAAKRSRGKNFNGHEKDGASAARTVCERLRMSRADSDWIVAMIEDHLKFKDVFGMRESTLQRFIQQPYFEELLALHRADTLASDGNLAFHEFCSSRVEERRKLSLLPGAGEVRLIRGEDLMQLGLAPGPIFSEILRTIEDLAMEKKLASKEEALEYVVKHFVR